jgi:ribulose-phosphate 3-epimerase
MVEEPIYQVKGWHKAGAARIVGHIEEMEDQEMFVKLVSKLGVEVGLALNVSTPLSDLDMSLVSGLDVVLLMAHEIGMQGLPFDKAVLPKIQELRKRFPMLNIEVDGGVNAESIVWASEAGANYFAVGSDIFKAKDPKAHYDNLMMLVS